MLQEICSIGYQDPMHLPHLLRTLRLERTLLANFRPKRPKLEAAKLAIQSLKDVGSVFSSGSDDAVQPIDTRPVFENPELGTLNLLHQGQKF